MFTAFEIWYRCGDDEEVALAHRNLTKAQLGAYVDRVGIAEKLGKAWAKKTGEQILETLAARGCAPPYIYTRRREAGSGRGVEYLPSAKQWLLELARRVGTDGWKNARAPMRILRLALQAQVAVASPENALLARVILDRAFTDLLNLDVRENHALEEAADCVCFWRGDPHPAEEKLTELVEREAEKQREKVILRERGNVVGAEELVGGIGAVLAPPRDDLASVFLGKDLESFRERQEAWRETLLEIIENPDRERDILRADPIGSHEAETQHIHQQDSALFYIPAFWEEYVRYRLTALAFDADIALPKDVEFGRTVASTFALTVTGTWGLRLPDGSVAGGVRMVFD